MKFREIYDLVKPNDPIGYWPIKEQNRLERIAFRNADHMLAEMDLLPAGWTASEKCDINKGIMQSRSATKKKGNKPCKKS